MPSFVRDLQLQIHTPDGTTSVQAPPDVKVSKFLDDLREPIHLRSKNAEGRRIQWRIYDRNGNCLDPNRTLGENGVAESHDLYLRDQTPDDAAKERREKVVDETHEKRPVNVLKRCDNAHYYDPAKYKACPYCEARRRR
jgi:hypothetical protein